MRLQRALGGGKGVGGARVGGDGFAQRTRDGLERGLDDVVHVLARELLDVQGDTRVSRERDEELLGQRRVERPDHLVRDLHIPVQRTAAGDVHRCDDERLVHGQHDGAETRDAALITQSLVYDNEIKDYLPEYLRQY